MGKAFEASRVTEGANTHIHWSSTLQHKQNSKLNTIKNQQIIRSNQFQIQTIECLIGIRIADQQSFKRVSKNNPPVISLVRTRLPYLYIFLTNSHFWSQREKWPLFWFANDRLILFYIKSEGKTSLQRSFWNQIIVKTPIFFKFI